MIAGSAADVPTWNHAWETLGPEPKAEEDEAPEDRLARALVLANAQDSAHRDQAIERLESLLEDLPATSPFAPGARTYLASLLIRAGRAQRACQVASISANSGNDFSAIHLYAQALIEAKKWDQASEQIDRLMAFGPDDPRIARLRASLIQARNGKEAAVAALEKAVADRDKSVGSVAFDREVIGQLLRMGQPAAEAAERVARIVSERHPDTSWMLARLRASQGKPAEALELCRRSLESGEADDRLQAVRVALEVAVAAGSDPKVAAQVEAILNGALGAIPGPPS